MQPKEENSAVRQVEEISIKLDLGGIEREYNLDEIKELAQKGHNYDLIVNDWECVKAMAFAEGKSVGEYLKCLSDAKLDIRRGELLGKCADEQLVDYVLDLEAENTFKNDNFFDEVAEYFPKIKNISELPVSVVENAKIKGSRILDEWLRYRHKKQMQMLAFKDSQKSVFDSSIGPQKEYVTADYDMTKQQFINGIWGK